MFPSDRFIGKIQKQRKANRTRPREEQVAVIGQTFLEVNRHLPSELVEELFQHFAGELEAGDGPEPSPFDACSRLGDVVDVLHEEYDVDADPLSAADWSVIGEIVSAHALKLEMNYVTYVMKLAVDHHAL